MAEIIKAFFGFFLTPKIKKVATALMIVAVIGIIVKGIITSLLGSTQNSTIVGMDCFVVACVVYLIFHYHIGEESRGENTSLWELGVLVMLMLLALTVSIILVATVQVSESAQAATATESLLSVGRPEAGGVR